MISQEQKLTSLTSVDNNPQWGRPNDMIKLCGFYKYWDNSGALLRSISNPVMSSSNRHKKCIITIKNDNSDSIFKGVGLEFTSGMF